MAPQQATTRTSRIEIDEARPAAGRKVLHMAAAVAVLAAAYAVPAGAAAPADLPDLLQAPASAALPLSLPAADDASPAPMQLATHQAAKSSGKSGSGGSGLGWKSGAACHTAAFDSWRGRPSDVYTAFSGRASFPAVVKLVKGSYIRGFASKRGELSLGLALLANNTRGKWGDCNSGKFDGYFREIGKALKSHGLGNAIIRLGWEANGSGFPWYAGNQAEAYKACFRRQVKNLKSQAPGLRIEWTMRKGNGLPYSVEKIYPGNDVVDIIGVLYYDRFPAVHTEKQWQASLKETHRGGPKGLATYLQFAKSRGKKLAVPEWGVSDGYKGAGARDNPFFIEKMFQFFKANAGSIAYETYFNCNPASIYKIHPAKHNPKAAAKYQQLW